MAREGMDVGGTGRNKSDSRGIGGGNPDRGSRGGPPRRAGKRRKSEPKQKIAFTPPGYGERASGNTTAQRVIESVLPSGSSPGIGFGVGPRAGAAVADLAESLGLAVDRTARPPEGRDGSALRRTRLRPLAGDAPVGTAPLTGSADEESGEGSEIKRKRRTILGAANVRRPVLSSAVGARFLGR